MNVTVTYRGVSETFARARVKITARGEATVLDEDGFNLLKARFFPNAWDQIVVNREDGES